MNRHTRINSLFTFLFVLLAINLLGSVVLLFEFAETSNSFWMKFLIVSIIVSFLGLLILSIVLGVVRSMQARELSEHNRDIAN